MSAPHSYYRCGIGFRDFGGHRFIGLGSQQSALKNWQDFVAGDWLSQLVHTRGKLVNLSKESNIAQRLSGTPGERIDERRIDAACNLHGQILEEVLGLSLKCRIEDRHCPRSLHVLQHLIQEQKHRSSASTFGEQFTDHITAWSDAVSVMSLHQRKGFLGVDLPGNPSPHRLNVLWLRPLACISPSGSSFS